MKTTMIMAFTLFLICHVKIIQSQFDPSNILLSIAKGSDPSKIDDRTAEEIKSIYSSPDITNIISSSSSSSSSSSITEYFTPNQNETDDMSPLDQWQQINTLFVINITLAIDKRINETNQEYSNYISIWGSSMKKALDKFFSQAENDTSSSSSSSSSSISLTPIFLAALDVSSSFNATTNPIFSNLTVSNRDDLFQLARMIWVSREIMSLLSLTAGDNPNIISEFGKELLDSNLQSFQRIFYAINTMTSYQLLDLITELDFLPFVAASGVTRGTSSPSPSPSPSPSSSPSLQTNRFTEFFLTGTLPPDSTQLEEIQASNTRQVIDILNDLDEKINSTNQEYGSSISIFGSSMTAALAQLFDGAERIFLSFSSSSSSFPDAEQTPSSPSPSSISLASLDTLPEFDASNSPILSNLTTSFKQEFFQLSRMIFVSRKIVPILNGMTSDDMNGEMLKDHILRFRRIFYAINSLTSYQLMDLIPELSLNNAVQASNVDVTQKRKKKKKFKKD